MNISVDQWRGTWWGWRRRYPRNGE